MILAGVMDACRDFDRAVVTLELSLRVVMRARAAPAAKVKRALVLLAAAQRELSALVRDASILFEMNRKHAPDAEVRQAGERLALVQLVLAHRLAARSMGERVQGQLQRGVITGAEAEQWAGLCFGLVSCDLPVEAWTDNLKIPARKPAVEAG